MADFAWLAASLNKNSTAECMNLNEFDADHFYASFSIWTSYVQYI